jgi:hypothetical protein
MWAGIQRSDNLNQDDNADEIHKAGSEDGTTPRSAPEAAWAAFIQALFGSAEFQFIR